tara:strand:+ start:778 stop:879 length:102 start_codon:yes stop_codon:yes gene_type:complete
MEEYGRKEQIMDAVFVVCMAPFAYILVVLAMCL